MKEIFFLINPISGKQAGQNLKECIVSELSGVLDSGSYDIEYTEKCLEKQCKDLFSNYEIVVIAGGDGTVSQVVKIISRLDKRPKLGIIPIGTGNDLANSFGILRLYETGGLGALLRMILRGNTSKIDILSLGDGSIFTNYLGIGCDAKISCDFNRLRPVFRKICSCISNKVFYGLLTLKNFFYRIPFNVEVRYENEHSATEVISLSKGLCEIVISNSKIYAGMELSSKCEMDDGKFEVTVIRSTWEWILLLFALLCKKPLDTLAGNLTQFQTDRVQIDFTGDTFCQIDGEKYDSFAEGEKKLLVNVVSSCELIVP